MRNLVRYVVLFAALMLPLTSPSARPDVNAVPVDTRGIELIVMEADGCIYCRLFRRDVLPSFSVSERARTLPVRFLDVNDIDEDNLSLDLPISIVPTFVVVKAGKEVGRIPGYVGPNVFFQSINHLLAQVD